MADTNASKELWHYTTLENCLSILQSKELWLSNLLNTNDGTDGRWAQQLLVDYCVPLLLKTMNREQRRMNKDTMQPETKQRLDIAFGAWIGPQSKFDSFIFCVSEPCKRNPHDGRLSMWRSYSGEKPIAIVFNAEKLMTLFKDVSTAYTIAHVISPVHYLHKVDAAAMSVFKNELQAIADSLFCHGITPHDYKPPEETMEALCNAVAKMSAAMKHEGFYEEAEMRVSLTTTRLAQSHADLQKNGRLILSLGDALIDAIDHIVIGPMATIDRQQIKSDLLRLYPGIQLRDCAIPFQR